MTKNGILIVLALVCVLSVAPMSNASTIIGDGKYGDFTGDFSYSYEPGGTEATIVIKLTNTSPLAYGGYLTAFGFNLPKGITGVSMSSTDPDFGLIGGADTDNSVKAVPYGYFDVGASIGSKFLGGRNPAFGIPAGGSEMFTFFLSGIDLDKLDMRTFFHEKSYWKHFPKGHEFFIGRFRGFHCGWSDKTPGRCVPIPGVMWLLGTGFVGLIGFRNHFLKKS